MGWDKPNGNDHQRLRLAFFTRLLDQADATERYRLATAQIMHAERCGFDSAWVAQHHFHEDEAGIADARRFRDNADPSIDPRLALRRRTCVRIKLPPWAAMASGPRWSTPVFRF
jgi:alkanesulfonate monooxygenase SsuD/methylene tetrahydromethanopterin reductase-like flavin-dependent oxidoreductase (luciferase family)